MHYPISIPYDKYGKMKEQYNWYNGFLGKKYLSLFKTSRFLEHNLQTFQNEISMSNFHLYSHA